MRKVLFYIRSEKLMNFRLRKTHNIANPYITIFPPDEDVRSAFAKYGPISFAAIDFDFILSFFNAQTRQICSVLLQNSH